MIYHSKHRQLLQPKKATGIASTHPKLREAPELGFGSRPSTARLVQRDGTFNVRRIGERRSRFSDVFHSLIMMGWGKFFSMLFLGFVAMNILFATIYMLLGAEHMQGIIAHTLWEEISEAFFFSTQTLTTLGYGRISPVGFWTSMFAAIESMLGLLGFAMATGILYARFSHPEAKIIYAKNAVIAPFQGGRAFMMRLANGRRNSLIEIEALAIFSRNELTDAGALVRKFYPMPLQISRVTALVSSWTIVHPINDESPFAGATAMDLAASEAEVMLQIKAYDETYSQTVYSRSSWTDDEIIIGAKFISAISTDEDGTSVLDLRMMDEYESVELPQEKAAVVS
ncbi:MAG: hypothetical protein JSS75_11965 [Bacteroidetes bacterium]|nr:hypothetical protein [Bacteroidota bacterium]